MDKVLSVREYKWEGGSHM